MAMDWAEATARYCEALKRIVALMVAMAGAVAAPAVSPRQGDHGEHGGGGVRPSGDRAPTGVTLPRHLYRAVLGILRPAEAAARRLIVVAARGLVVPPARLRPAAGKPPRKPSPTAIVFPHGGRAGTRYGARSVARLAAGTKAAPARVCLPLCDTLRPPSRRPRCVPARAAPRITLPGLTARHRLPPEPTPFDPIDATRLNLRLAALQAVLDDLPGQARRFARWRARRDAMLAQRAAGRAGQDPPGGRDRRPDRRPAAARPRRALRLSPLRPGRPPGFRRRGRREVHELLDDLQKLAWWVLERPDTS